MKNGDAEFAKALEQAEKLAEKYEFHLPHVSDLIYSLVKLIRNYDKNQKAMVKYIVQAQRANKQWKRVCDAMYMFLNWEQRKYIKQFSEELNNDTARINSNFK